MNLYHLFQKCICCNKYFMMNQAKHRKGNRYSFEQGLLSYGEMREALAQLKDSLEGPDRMDFLLEYVWAYNDAFQREQMDSCPQPDDAQLEEFRTVVRDLIAALPPESRIIHAEFLREAKFFEEALEIVDHEDVPNDPILRELSTIIREKSIHRDSTVGIISVKR